MHEGPAAGQEGVALLGGLGVGLVEISGGSVESPAMQGGTAGESTLAREAYFLAFAEKLLSTAPMALMITGGITRRAVVAVAAADALARGIAVVGMGTALALVPDLPLRWRDGESAAPALKPVTWKDRSLAGAAQTSRVRHQLHRVAAGRRPTPGFPSSLAFALDRHRRSRSLRTYRAWLPAHPTGVEVG